MFYSSAISFIFSAAITGYMRVYPLDFSAKDNIIRIHAWSETGRVVLSEPFSNYFYAYPRVPEDFADDRIAKIVPMQKEYYGEILDVSQIVLKRHYEAKDVASSMQSKLNLKYVLEADVPVIRKYLYDCQVDPLKGYEIADTSADSSADSSGSLADFSARKATGEFIELEQLRVVGFDIETYAKTKSIDSKQNPILMMALYVSQHGNVQKFVLTYGRKKSAKSVHDYVELLADEKSMLARFNELLKSLKADIICGYNSDAFDWPYVADRCEKYGIKLDFGVDGSGLTFGGGTLKTVYLTGSPHIDICNFIRVNMRSQLKTTTYSLDAVSNEILGEKKIEVAMSDLYKAWDAQDSVKLDRFVEYNLHDSYLCVKLLEKLFPNILEFVGMIRLAVEDATRMSYSQLVESYLMNRTRAKNISKLGIMIPPKPSRQDTDDRMALPPNEGAFVFKPTPGLYKNIVVCDFRSLYPSIIASLNIERSSMNKSTDPADRVPEYNGELYFAKSPKAFIPTVIEDIILRRVEIKRLVKAAGIAGNEREKSLLEARSYNLKILANALYGYLSFAPGRWYCEECGGATTAYARHFIKYTIKQAQDAGFNVIYSDTDSIFIELKAHSAADAKKFVAHLNEKLPGIIELQFEDEFSAGIFVGAKNGTGGAKKRYALLSTSGKFKITGFEYVRNDWCDYARETQYNVISILLKENDPKKAFEYARGRVKELYAGSGSVPIEQLILRDKLSRDVSEYETNLPHVIIARRMQENGEPVGRGKIISYVVTQGKGPIYERVAVPDAVTVSQLDMEYYANNQVIPVVDSIFQVFGYKKEDFAAQKNQTGLGQFF